MKEKEKETTVEWLESMRRGGLFEKKVAYFTNIWYATHAVMKARGTMIVFSGKSRDCKVGTGASEMGDFKKISLPLDFRRMLSDSWTDKFLFPLRICKKWHEFFFVSVEHAMCAVLAFQSG